MKEIVEIICDFYSIYPKKVFTINRKREIVKCRQLSMYIGRCLTNLSLPEIGAFFNKDHTTVIHSIKAVEKDMETNKKFKHEVNMLLFKIQKAISEDNLRDKYFCNPMIYSRIVRRYRAYS